MKGPVFALVSGMLMHSTILFAQYVQFDKVELQAHKVTMSKQKLIGKNTLRVIKDSTVQAVDEPTFVRLKDADFKNGTIEVKVLSRLLKNAPEFARGFIGVAFRINDSNTQYESIYIRPTNGRANDQIRRNHSIQYYAYPNFKFDRLRKDAPEKYESYADMELNRWITLRIEVDGAKALLFIDDSKHPSLVVYDLKLGANHKGAIGLWVEIGTEGFFSDLKITKKD